MTYVEQARNLLFPKPPALNHDESLTEREETGSGLLALISSLEENGYLLGCGFLATDTGPLFWSNPDSVNQIRVRGHNLLQKLISETNDPIQLVLADLFLAKLYTNPIGTNVEQQAMYTHYRRLTANVLVKAFADSANRSSFLVSGFNIRSNLAERWEIDVIDYEIQEGHMQYSNEELLFGVPGAFQIFIGISEYELASQIADSNPGAFRHPGVCGWREVCRAFMSKEDPSAYYLKAAEIFASDILPENRSDRNSPYWSGFNSQTLAPYFRARAVLSKPNTDPSEMIEALSRAAGEIELKMSGFVYPPARSLAILVHALGSFLVTKDESVLDKLSQDYQKEIKLWSSYSQDDEIILNSLNLISKAIEGFRYDPIEELKSTRLSDGINGLESIPESSQFQFVSQLVPVFAETALEISQGTTYGEVNSTLRLIKQEDKLQKLMLLLLEAKGALHAKITCGPLEYGKDIIAVVDDVGVATLHFYAVKVGDIDRGKWDSVKESIDQMFTVPVDNPMINQIAPTKIYGFLVFNGHFNEYIDPIVSAWLEEVTSRGWDITVMDIDSLGRWIVSKRLVGVLNKFASIELGR